jgi:NAD(P)-dependent dehydrogenase (short-subunit alcohol dehydrogenase family)
MRSRGGGSIVNIASIDGLAGGSGLAYPTTKGAVVNMTRALAFICGPARIRVNALAPGRIWSARLSDRPNVNEANRDRRRMASALETEGTPFDVGMAAVFLASDEARWITGVILPVDGGETAILRRPEVFSEEMLRSVGLRMESEVDPESVASS